MIINKDGSATLTPNEATDIQNLLNLFAKTENADLLADVGSYVDILFINAKHNKNDVDISGDLIELAEKINAGKLLKII